MDADLLRLALILLGVFFLLVIYLWERRKRARNKALLASAAGNEQRREPSLGMDGSGFSDDPEDQELRDSLHELRGVFRGDEDRDGPRRERSHPGAGPDGAAGDDRAAAEDVETPTLILQLVVAAKGDPFEGPDIRRVMEGLHMTPGEMSIYHRLDPLRPAGVPLFSLANMLNPGVFPFQDMEEFKTPGLAMFTQLPGPQDGQVVFAEMLRTAEEIALQLGGELHDETHSVLTKQRIEHIKSEIVEHRRKLQLAKRRPK